MKLNITKEWLASHLEADEGHDFTAGSLCVPDHEEQSADVQVNPLHDAFGQLVLLWRLEHNYSIDKLAQAADVDLDEISNIEEDETYRAEARTVCAIANVMRVPEIKLLQLSGNAKVDDLSFKTQSSAFAANAKRWQQISNKQKKLLKEYMKFLAQK